MTLFVGTRKGAWIFDRESSGSWRSDGPISLGHIVSHMVMDPRDGQTILMATSTGHLGPTVLRSRDRGKTWVESSKPPAFPSDDRLGRALDRVFYLAPSIDAEPDVWYAGG